MAAASVVSSSTAPSNASQIAVVTGAIDSMTALRTRCEGITDASLRDPMASFIDKVITVFSKTLPLLSGRSEGELRELSDITSKIGQMPDLLLRVFDGEAPTVTEEELKKRVEACVAHIKELQCGFFLLRTCRSFADYYDTELHTPISAVVQEEKIITTFRRMKLLQRAIPKMERLLSQLEAKKAEVEARAPTTAAAAAASSGPTTADITEVRAIMASWETLHREIQRFTITTGVMLTKEQNALVMDQMKRIGEFQGYFSASILSPTSSDGGESYSSLRASPPVSPSAMLESKEPRTRGKPRLKPLVIPDSHWR